MDAWRPKKTMKDKLFNALRYLSIVAIFASVPFMIVGLA